MYSMLQCTNYINYTALFRFLVLLLKQLVLFSARRKPINKMIYDSFVSSVNTIIREKIF